MSIVSVPYITDPSVANIRNSTYLTTDNSSYGGYGKGYGAVSVNNAKALIYRAKSDEYRPIYYAPVAFSAYENYDSAPSALRTYISKAPSGWQGGYVVVGAWAWGERVSSVTTGWISGATIVDSLEEAYTLFGMTRVSYPITYRPTRVTLDGPATAAVGATVNVDCAFPEGYGIKTTDSITVTCNRVPVPFSWDSENQRVTFTMPDPTA